MAQLLGGITSVTKQFLDINTVSIDNWGFKLFYKWSTSLLGVCSVLVTGRQFFGSPIKCDAGAAAAGVRQEMLETYCWMYSTFRIPTNFKGQCSGGDQDEDLNMMVYNSYYQWVPIYLIAFAFLFYVPRMIWMGMEGGLMKFFCSGTTTRYIEDQEEKRDKLVRFFQKNIRNSYNRYFGGFVFCEFLNILIVLFHFVFTHRFLNRRYIDYGFRVMYYSRLPMEEQKMPGMINPMCRTFPRVASCNYWRYGTGGHQENINAICILALNIVNDKVFFILWWWFLFILIVGVIRFIYRAVQCMSSRVRYHLIGLRIHRYLKKTNKARKVEKFIRQCKLGDWFVIYQFSKNCQRPFFMDFLTQLSLRNTVSTPQYDSDPDDGMEDGLFSMSELLRPMTQQRKYRPSNAGLGHMPPPVRTTDGLWMGSMDQLSVAADCPPGLKQLTHLDGLVIKKKVEVLNYGFMAVPLETKNEYRINNSHGQTLWKVQETAQGVSRLLCGGMQAFEVTVKDQSSTPIIEFQRPKDRRALCLPGPQLEVCCPPGTVIGTVYREWSFPRPKFSVNDDIGKKFAFLTGPPCGGGYCGQSEFVISIPCLLTGKVEEVGMVGEQHHTRNPLDFGIRFPSGMDVKNKATLLGACFLISSLYFQREEDEEQESTNL